MADKTVELKKHLEKPKNHLFMTLYEEIIAKSKNEGIIEGEQKGAENLLKNVVLKSFDSGVSIDLIVNITGHDEQKILQILNENGRNIL